MLWLLAVQVGVVVSVLESVQGRSKFYVHGLDTASLTTCS
jgi:hypothetical protein